MSLQVCTLGGKPYLVGLEWNSMPTEAITSRAKEQERRVKKSLGNVACLTLKKGDYTVIGHAPKAQFKALKNGAKYPSVTALLMMAAPEGARWIVRQALDDGQVWLGVLVDGVPYADSDKVLSIEAADQYISTLQSTDTYEIFDDALGELLEKIDKKQLRLALVTIQGEKAAKIMASVLLIAALAAAATFGVNGYRSAEWNRLRLAQIDAATQASLAEAQREAQVKRETRLQELASKLRKSTASEQVGLWFAVLNSQSLDVEKWGLRSAACEASICTLTYLRSKGLLQRFMARYPDARFNLSKPNEIVVILGVTSIAPALTHQELKGAFTAQIHSTIGHLMHMTSNADVIFAPTVADIDSTTFAKTGSWAASGKRLTDIRDFAELLDKNALSPNFSIQTMTLKLNGSQLERWDIKGEYVFLADTKTDGASASPT